MLNHLAIIMDGNGRWAESKNLERQCGHIKGEKTFVKICKAVADNNIKYLSVFAFSTENWSRNDVEVTAILEILEKFFNSCAEFAKENNYKISAMGTRENLTQSFIDAIEEAEFATCKNDGLNIQIAIDYGGKSEIVRAIKRCNNKRINPLNISEKDISSNMDMPHIPPPDLLIRTGGEKRLSNFMLWELAYTELYFTDVLWPDFDENALNNALNDFASRNRRYGKTE